MGEKAYTKGSKFPPITNPDKIRLYGMRFCPYVRRVLLVLVDNNTQFEAININLAEKPEWYLQRFPEGKVPAIELNGNFLYESLIIADFLNEISPEHKLHPAEPIQKALDKCLLSKFSAVTDNWKNAIYHPENAKEIIEAIWASMVPFEEELAKRATSYFGGSKPSMLDFMIWPWFEMTPFAEEFLGQEYPYDYVLSKEKFPKLKEWINIMLLYPAVKQLHNKEHLIAWAKSVRAKKFDFDAGLN